MPWRNGLAILASVVAASLCVGCSGETDSEFTCETDEDCLAEQGYECDTEINRCFAPGGGEEERCIDEDGDGYGTGTNREGCVTQCEENMGENCSQRSEEDCDDTDPEVHPGAPEICDGKVNNCELGADEEAVAFSCNESTDNCPAVVDEPEGVASHFVDIRCEDSQCVYSPLNQAECSVEGQTVRLTCENGENYSWVRDETKSYEDLPPDCRE